jgi:RNase P protein component
MKGRISNGKEFLELIHHGFKRGRPKFFTYVIDGNEFRFSETGVTFTRDFASKHAVHANASRSVVYAGEFHVYNNADKHILVIDNGSGTFSPDSSLLTSLQSLLQQNFPGLEVLDF